MHLVIPAPAGIHAEQAHSQLIFVREGRGEAELEGTRVPFVGPCAMLLPSDCAHGRDVEVDQDRWVVTIEASYLAQINARLQELTQLWSGPRIIPLSYTPEVERESYQLVRRLEQEMLASAVGRAAALEALLTMLLITLLRAIPSHQFEYEGGSPAHVRQVECFRDLVNQHYGKNLRLHEYASMMAVSVSQLRAVCSSALGQSPSKIIHSRIVTEAKRSLIFSDLPVEQIAFRLGFDDAAYFTRFFRREVGQTPSQFRTTAKN